MFREGDTALNYYQVSSGEVKMTNFNLDGKEFIQGIFSPGQSFGEPPLFANVKYPANAEAITDSSLLQFHKEGFQELLVSKSRYAPQIRETLAKRRFYKAITASEISSPEPKTVTSYLRYHKKYVQKKRG